MADLRRHPSAETNGRRPAAGGSAERIGAARMRARSSRRRFAAAFDSVCPPFPQELRFGGSIETSMISVDQTGHEKTMPALGDIVFRLVRGGSLTRSVVDIGDGAQTLSGRVGGVYVAPAGADASWLSEGDHSLLMIAAPEKRLRSMIERATGGLSSDEDPLRSLYGREIFDPGLAATMENAWRAAAEKGPSAHLLVDGYLTALLGLLLRAAGRAPGVEQPQRTAALDGRRLDRVRAFVDDNLDRQISLEEIAAAAGLSVFHFARSFRAAADVSPLRYVMMRRVEAARRLLAETEEPLAEIAYLCGFSSQAHFSTAFKKHVGATPGAFRTASKS
ncbi:MAG: AraC family transcriptional regulator [Pseudomonadota bacterium]